MYPRIEPLSRPSDVVGRPLLPSRGGGYGATHPITGTELMEFFGLP